MTRFHITIEQAVDLVITALDTMTGGEIYVPKIPSFRVIDLIQAMGCEPDIVGIRPGEKLHEVLITRDEARQTYYMGGYYVISEEPRAIKVPEGFSYTSDNNDEWLFT
jgi:UDP-N-acetylglucosamine 4,6-dehydratase